MMVTIWGFMYKLDEEGSGVEDENGEDLAKKRKCL